MKNNRSHQVYAWQRMHWQQLHAQIASDRLPHAILLHGPEGLGKKEFADFFVASLCCVKPDSDHISCGQCSGCLQLQNSCHPDVMVIAAEEEGGSISVDQIRALPHFVAQTHSKARYKIVLISAADRMNAAAANALLKTLEEPTPDTVLILTSDRADQLTPTIRSRCCSYYFAPLPSFSGAAVDIEEVKDDDDLCALSLGAPLRALALLQDGELSEQRALMFTQLEQLVLQQACVVNSTQKLNAIEPLQLLQWLQSAVIDLVRVQSGLPVTALMHRDQAALLTALAPQLDNQKLFATLDLINQTLQMLVRQRNLNFQLCCETIFFQWKQGLRK